MHSELPARAHPTARMANHRQVSHNNYAAQCTIAAANRQKLLSRRHQQSLNSRSFNLATMFLHLKPETFVIYVERRSLVVKFIRIFIYNRTSDFSSDLSHFVIEIYALGYANLSSESYK